MPHGTCGTVHLGGHVQTGGYGTTYRAFGLLGEHVVSFILFTADGARRTITQQSNPELFFAVLGGIPGNFGILTRVTLRVHLDRDHPHARELFVTYLYRKDHLAALLKPNHYSIFHDCFPLRHDFSHAYATSGRCPPTTFLFFLPQKVVW